MNKTPLEQEYCAFINREVVDLETIIDNTDIEREAIYEYAALKLGVHFSAHRDCDQIRTLLGQDPEVTRASHTLAGLFFAEAAKDLLVSLIENSPEATGQVIGPIIGVEVPIARKSVDAAPKTRDELLDRHPTLPLSRKKVLRDGPVLG